MSGTTYYQRNREVMLNRANEYYENNKEVLREKSKNKYRESSEEEENIKGEYAKNRYHNMSEEEKQRLKEYDEKHLMNQIRMIKSKGWVTNIEIETIRRKIENESRDEVNEGTIKKK